MCGRYALHASVSEFLDYFSATCKDLDWQPHYNVAPLQFVPVIRQRPTGERVAQLLRWGLIPSWAKDESIGGKLINARGETVGEKPAFRSAFKSRRCIIPASGFFEWQAMAGGKQPFLIQPAQATVFGIAGLWERWSQPDGNPLDTFTIITIDANQVMQAVHDRMPVILHPDNFASWLNRETPADVVSGLIRPCDPALLKMHPVSKAVGNVRNDSPELIAPTASPAPGPG